MPVVDPHVETVGVTEEPDDHFARNPAVRRQPWTALQRHARTRRQFVVPAAEDRVLEPRPIGAPLAPLAERQLVDVTQDEIVAPVEVQLLPVAPRIDIEAQPGVFRLVPERLSIGV